MATTWSISRRTGTAFAWARLRERGATLCCAWPRASSSASISRWRPGARSRSGSPRREGRAPALLDDPSRGEARKTVQLDLDSLDRLFLQLEGRPEREVRELRYVLCLLLMASAGEGRAGGAQGRRGVVPRQAPAGRPAVHRLRLRLRARATRRPARAAPGLRRRRGPHGVRLVGEEDEIATEEPSTESMDGAHDAAGEAEPGGDRRAEPREVRLARGRRSAPAGSRGFVGPRPLLRAARRRGGRRGVPPGWPGGARWARAEGA